MYKLRKQFKFEAAHQLIGHDGKCARLHGHSWVGWVEIEGNKLMAQGPKQFMLMDYYDINIPLKELVEEKLDHYFLNETLDTNRPTSEFIAQWIFQYLFPKYTTTTEEAHQGVTHRLVAVIIEETCTSAAEYRP